MDTPYEKLLAKLARADVRFVIVGGVAVALNGFVRTTEDVDILIESSADNVTRLLDALGNFGEGHARELSPTDFSDSEGAIRIIEVFLFEQVKLLCKSFADGNDHASVVFKLIHERLRNLVRGAGHNNGVERRLLRPPLITVAHLQMHVLVT